MKAALDPPCLPSQGLAYSWCSINVIPCTSGTHPCLCMGLGIPRPGPAVVGSCLSLLHPVPVRVTEGASLSACWHVLPVTRTPRQASLESCGDRTKSLIPFLLEKKK